ncbi:MAG: flagellar hook-length control protein FliK [Desulfobacterota bacterium]|nr:flagellar hook-length control protein FliK [Thermodesulfobacteriota bacterium]
MKTLFSPTSTTAGLIRLDATSMKALLPLEIGQVLKGKVLEVIDGRQAILQVKESVFKVESRIPLREGMEGRFEVTALRPHILLKLLPGEEEMLSSEAKRGLASLLTALPSEALSQRLHQIWEWAREKGPPQIRATIERLWQLGTSISPGPSGLIGPEQIERWIAGSGLFFGVLFGEVVKEGKLNRNEERWPRDLKGLLMRLKGQLLHERKGLEASALGPRELEELLEGVDLLLQRIEAYQQLSAASFQTGGKLFLLLPLWMDGFLRFVDLQVSLHRRQDPQPSEGEGRTIQFLLHLPEWGKVSIEVQTIGRRLLGRCLFSQEDVATFFRENLPDLLERLVGLGFQPEIEVTTQRAEKILENFLAEIKGGERPFLDLIV